VLIELHRKAGTLCQPARQGRLHCPLIVRPTSEDNVTGHLVTVLRALNPRHWVSDLLNQALGTERFRRQVYRRFRIKPWVGKPPFPRELLHWDEGGTEVDIQLTWENPPTTVYVECKFGSPLSTRTNQNDGSHGYPGDQLSRNIRVGLHECGYYQTNALFESAPRDFAVVVLAPVTGRPLVREYRDPERLRHAIPHSDRINFWPRFPFVGEIGYSDIRHVLRDRRRFYTRAERSLIDALLEYLDYKGQSRPNRSGYSPTTAIDDRSETRQPPH
jgi:hypothetical protein